MNIKGRFQKDYGILCNVDVRLDGKNISKGIYWSQGG